MLAKILKWTGVTLLLLVSVLTVAVLFLQNRTFDGPYPNVHASRDTAVIARGKYLVMGPAHCADCHGAAGSEKLVDIGLEVPLTGGKFFAIPPGKIYPRNITPDPSSGIGRFTDEQIARSLRYGIGTDGRAMFDFMSFHNVSDEDLTAIISYLRNTKPVHNNVVEESQYSLLGKVLKSFVIKPTGPSVEVPKSIKPDTTAAYGKYLAYSVANCRGCHTDRDLKTGAFVGKEYAGGFVMESMTDPGYVFKTPNLTPEPKTGRIYGWTQEQFIKRFREGKKFPQSPMPWGPFSRLHENDLKAIYKYLQTVVPVENAMTDMIVVKK